MAQSLTQLARKQRLALLKMDADNLERVANAYTLMYERLQGDIKALMLVVDGLNNPTAAQIKKLAEYKTLMVRVERETSRFMSYLETALDSASFDAIRAGLKDSAELISAGIGGRFLGIAPNAMREALRYLSEDGPLYARLKFLTGEMAEEISRVMFEGIGAGYNPNKIAALIQDAFGGGLTDALRNMRTLQLYSYRDSARANYMESGVVDKWMWWAELDDLVCMSCVAEHGTLHDLDEQLDGHYNCRCAALPYIEGLTETQQSGVDWFNSLSDQQQSDMMGKEYHSAYKGGAFTLTDMIKPTENEIYGTMNTVTPLWELLGAEPP